MSTTSIRLKKSSIAGRIPGTSDLDFGEIAINIADGILYFKNSSNQVSSINARAIGVDSTATFSIIDSAYIQEKTSGAFDSDFALKTTSDLAEGTRLYYTTSRSDSDFDIRLATKSTTNLSEGTNLYFTTARADSDAKNAISVTDAGGDGSLSYNSTTGVLTYTGPSASEVRAHITANKGVSITSGEINIDSANVKGMFSGSGDLSYNSNTGQFSIDVSAVYTANDFDSDYILAKDSANTAVERNKHTDTTKHFAVTVASKDQDHVYFGNGSGLGYKVDGTFSPVIHLQLGRTYRFNLSSSDMSSHPFRFYYNADKSGGQYTSGVTTASTYAEITVSESTPSVLHYQCSAHGFMGHALVVGTRNLTGLTTTNLTEGTNQYFTNARVDSRLGATSQTIDGNGSTGGVTIADGGLTIRSGTGNPGQIDLYCEVNNAHRVRLKAPAHSNFSGNPDVVLPNTSGTLALTNQVGIDSSVAVDLIDSSYVQQRTRIGLDDIDFGSKKILYSNVYSQTSDLPSASTYHGMFAHVHATGKGYFAHGGNWIELANASQLFSGAYADLTGKPVLIDSGLTTSLIDSAYVRARQIQYTNADFTDSAFVTTQINNLIDAAPGALNTLNELAAAIGDDANFSTTITNSIAAKLDSAEAVALIDSAYIQARQINNPTGVDSAATQAMIDSSISFQVDSAYVQARQITNPSGVDSAATIALIDSAYVQARQSSGGSGTTDSAAVSAIILADVDSAYVQARQSSGGGGTTDSAAVLALIDSNHVQGRFNTLRESDNTLIVSGNIVPATDSSFSIGTAQKKFKDIHLSGGTVFIDNLALSADSATRTISIGELDSAGVVNVVGVIATVDSAGVSAIVDSAFLEARLQSFVSEAELAAENFLDSTTATALIDSAYVQARQTSGGGGTTDSAAVIDLIDSAYVQARQSLGNTGITVQEEGSSLATAGSTLNFVGSNITASGTGAVKTITVTGGLDSSTGIELINNTVNQAYINNKLGVDYGDYVVNATNALDILLASVNVDYGSPTAPAGLRSNYGTI